MTRITKLGWTALALGAAVIVVDQASKYWVVDVLRLQEGQTIPLFWPLRLTGVNNSGVSFGFLQGPHVLVRWMLTFFSLGVAIMLGFWVRQTQRVLFATAMGLLMGGAIGNAIDRVRLGAVVDFIDASPLYFRWIFNVADSAISIGICVLLLDMLRQDGVERARKAAVPGEGDAA